VLDAPNKRFWREAGFALGLSAALCFALPVAVLAVGRGITAASILLAIAVPLMAYAGFFLLASAILIVFRDVLGYDGKLIQRLGGQFGPAWELPRTERFVSLRRVVYAAFSVILALVGSWILRHGVVEPIGLFFFNYDIS
jgi:hypothetical protein